MRDPLEMGGGKGGCSRWSATGLGIRLEIWIWKRGGRGEDLQVVHPLFWLEWPLSSQETSSSIFTFWGPPHFPNGHINLYSCQ